MQSTSKLPLAYLVSRGITLEEIKRHRIGYIGSIFNNIPDTEDKNIKAFNKWLGYKGKFVANRIVFPIYNELGEIKGIETRGLDQRSMDSLKPKFKESLKEVIKKLPESTVRYKKFYPEKEKFSPFFFGLPGALDSIWEKKEVFITEGIFDAISLMKLFPNCISTLTANINDYQISWLKRYCEKVILVFDVDKKGKQSVLRIKDLLSDYLKVYSIGLPSADKDLNDFVVNKGIKELSLIVQEKMSMFY